MKRPLRERVMRRWEGGRRDQGRRWWGREKEWERGEEEEEEGERVAVSLETVVGGGVDVGQDGGRCARGEGVGRVIC